MLRRSSFAILTVLTLMLLIGRGAHLHAAAGDVVLYPSDVTTIRGNWARVASASGAGVQKMSSVDYGWSTTDAPLASPNDYFEASFSASAGTVYHVWLRLRADVDSKYNDSAWVQFSDS